jgi:transposase
MNKSRSGLFTPLGCPEIRVTSRLWSQSSISDKLRIDSILPFMEDLGYLLKRHGEEGIRKRTRGTN